MAYSTNARLSSLTYSGPLANSQTFDSSTFTYTVSVPDSVDGDIVLSAQRADVDATQAVTGQSTRGRTNSYRYASFPSHACPVALRLVNPALFRI